MTPLAPGLAVTVWDSGGLTHALDECLDELALIRPDVVQLHGVPRVGNREQRVRGALPGVRLWYGIPADHLARKPADAPGKAAGYALAASAAGAELLVLNGETAWVGASPELARDMLAACRTAAPGLALGWSTYDHPSYADHRGPWQVILGPDGVDYSLPQHYPGDAHTPAGPRDVLARIAASLVNHKRLSGLDPAMLPRGSRWIPYGQAWGHTAAGACTLHDQAAISASWCLPASSDATGVIALRADAAMRRAVGHAPGRIARYQTAHGLAPDGVVGPLTLKALGLA